MNKTNYKKGYELLKGFIEKELVRRYKKKFKEEKECRSIIVDNYYNLICKIEKEDYFPVVRILTLGEEQ